MIPRRPLRSVMLHSPRYLSGYVLGVAQAMGALGHWHRLVSLFDEAGDIDRQLREMQPDVIWTHCAAWPPPGATPVLDVLRLLAMWKRRGSCVFLHDGDPEQKKVDPDADMGATFSIALVNRAIDPNPWPMPSVHWPYAAFAQKEIAPPVDEWRCDLLFAGHLRRAEEGYGDRTKLVFDLHERLGPAMRIVSPGGGDINNRMLVADVAPSATAVLGFGRPDVPGWIDTRVYQWPGAGGLLIHDDGGGVLEAGAHYLRFDRNEGVESVLRCIEQAKQPEASAIRERAFQFIQANHTWRHRVEVALAAFYGRGG